MENLTSIRTEWRKAKARAAQLCLRAGREDVAQKLRVCTMFHGDETLEELIDKMFSPRGREFIARFDFPTLSVFRQFTKYDTQSLGVFIDAGDITLTDVQRVMLVGKTRAKLIYTQTKLNNIVVLRGAEAHIEANGYSVVSVDMDRTSKCRTILNDHAVVR